MEDKIYTIQQISGTLEICTTTVYELKRKLKIGKYVSQNDFCRIQNLVNDIRERYEKVTLSTINEFMLYHDISKY